MHDLRLHQRWGPIGALAADQPSETRDEGGGHTGAGCGAVVSTIECRGDHHSRRGDIYPLAVVRERSACVSSGRPADCQHVRIGRWVELSARVTVTYRRNHHCCLGRRLDSCAQGGRVSRASQADVDYVGTLGYRIVHPQRDVRVVGKATRLHHLDDHDATIPAHPGHADTVVGFGNSYAGDFGAVAVVIIDLIGLGDEIPAVNVVNVAIVVVVDAIVGCLARIAPQSANQIGMVNVDAGIQHGNDYCRRAGDDVPGSGCTNLRQCPLTGEKRVVGGGGNSVSDLINFSIVDTRVHHQARKCARNIASGSQAQAVDMGEGSFYRSIRE